MTKVKPTAAAAADAAISKETAETFESSCLFDSTIMRKLCTHPEVVDRILSSDDGQAPLAGATITYRPAYRCWRTCGATLDWELSLGLLYASGRDLMIAEVPMLVPWKITDYDSKESVTC